MKRLERFAHDGLDIPVEIWGSDNPPLVFLPGMGVHPAYYADGLSRLALHFTVTVPDLSFRTHDRLPETIERYLQLTEALAQVFAPNAPRAGHSFGGFLALLGDRPAVALSPTIPIRGGWTAKFGRAVHLQLREYAGFEGRRGICWAWSILRDYARTTALRPRCLFPAISETLRSVTDRYRPVAPAAHVVLARYDSLYRQREYTEYLSSVSNPDIVVRQVERGHDWPVTDPALLESEMLRAVPTARS